MLSILEYLDRAGSRPFASWFRTLDAAAVKITTPIGRLELGNVSNRPGADYKKRNAREK